MNKPTVVITHHALSRPEHTVFDVEMWHKVRWPDFIAELDESGLGEIVY